MRLVKVNNMVKREMSYKKTKNQAVIVEFNNSGEAIMEVLGYTNKNSKSCAGCLDQAAKRLTMYHIKAAVRGDHVYLVNTDKIKK